MEGNGIETGKEAVFTKDFVPINNPENPLYNTASDICDYTGLQIAEIPNVPLEYKNNNFMLGSGAQAIRIIDGKPVSFVIVKDSQPDKAVLVEETAHHIQSIFNDKLFKDRTEIARQNDLARKYSQDNVIYESVRESLGKRSIEFAINIGIDSSFLPQTIEEKDLLIQNRLKGLLPEQTARLYSALDQMGISIEEDSVREQFNRLVVDYTGKQKNIDELEEEQKKLELSGNAYGGEIKDRIRSLRDDWGGIKTISQVMRSQINERIAKIPESSDKVELLEKALEMSFIELDSLTSRSLLYQSRIDKLPPNNIRKAVSNIIANNPELDTLLLIDRGTSAEEMKMHMELLRHRDMADYKSDEYQRLKSDLHERVENQLINASEIDLTGFYKQAVIHFLHGVEKAQVANAIVEENLVFLFDDLPEDEESRKGLFGDAMYMQQLRDFVLESVKNGEISPFGSEEFNPESFATDTEHANDTLNVFMSKPLQNTDATTFLSDMKSTTEFVRSDISGDQYAILQESAEKNIETKLKEMFPDGDIGRIPTKSEYQDAKLAAYKESVEMVRRGRKENENKHTSDILTEPIAKVIAQKLSGGERNDIRFPESLFGGYSVLLRSDELNKWLDQLWVYMDKVHENKNSTGALSFKEFLSATDIDQQKVIVEKYLSLKRM